MTPAQKARTQGFLASLQWRGESLFLDPDQTELGALVEPIVPDAGEFSTSRTEATAVRIHILREDLCAAGAEIKVGSILRDPENARTFRVTKVDDSPTRIQVHFEAEVADVPAT